MSDFRTIPLRLLFQMPGVRVFVEEVHDNKWAFWEAEKSKRPGQVDLRLMAEGTDDE